MAFENQTLGEVLKLQDLPAEQKAEYLDLINLLVEKDSLLLPFARRLSLDANKTSIAYPLVIAPTIDKTGNEYKFGLAEGYSPEPETLEEIEIHKAVQDYGWVYIFTKKAINKSFRDIRTKLIENLRIKERKFYDEKIADAMFSSLNTLSAETDLCVEANVDKLYVMLAENDCEPIDSDGNYGLIVCPELARAMKRKYGELITHTSEAEAPIKGTIGVFGGFRIIEAKGIQAFRPTAGTKAPFVAFGKTAKGDFPIGVVDPAENADLVIKDFGSVQSGDTLNKIGSIGISLEGVGFYCIDDGAVIHGTSTTTGESYSTTSMAFDYKKLGTFDVSSSKIFPNVQALELGGDETFTIAVRDIKGADVTANCTFASTDAAVATVDNSTTKGKITPVAKGKTVIKITKDSLTTYVPVVITTAPSD